MIKSPAFNSSVLTIVSHWSKRASGPKLIVYLILSWFFPLQEQWAVWLLSNAGSSKTKFAFVGQLFSFQPRTITADISKTETTRAELRSVFGAWITGRVTDVVFECDLWWRLLQRTSGPGLMKQMCFYNWQDVMWIKNEPQSLKADSQETVFEHIWYPVTGCVTWDLKESGKMTVGKTTCFHDCLGSVYFSAVVVICQELGEIYYEFACLVWHCKNHTPTTKR